MSILNTRIASRPLVLLALALRALAEAVAQDGADGVAAGPAGYLEAAVVLEYAYGDGPLGAIDSIRLATPLAFIDAGLEAPSGLGVGATAFLVAEYRLSSEYSLPLGREGNPVAIENNLMTRGVLYAPLFDGVARIGRQKVSFGPDGLNGLMVDTHVPYLDAVYYSLPLGRFVISQAVATLENEEGDGDLAYFITDGWDTDPDYYGFGVTNILLSSRRFAWVGDRYEIGLGVQSLFSRPGNAFQLGEVLPVFSVHNSDVGDNNITLLLDFEWRGVPGHRQYAVVGFDDFNAKLFNVADSSGIPTIWAVQGGAAGTVAAGSYAFDYAAEVVATHYLWGSFDDELALSRAVYRLKADGGSLLLPLSSPFGPARLSFQAESTLRAPGPFSLGLSGLLLYGDPDVDLVSGSYEARDVDYEFMLLRLELRATRGFGPGLSLSAACGGDVLPDELSPRLSVSGSWRYPSR